MHMSEDTFSDISAYIMSILQNLKGRHCVLYLTRTDLRIYFENLIFLELFQYSSLVYTDGQGKAMPKM